MTLPTFLNRSTTTFIRLTLKFGIDSVLLLSIMSTAPLDVDSSSLALVPQILSTLRKTLDRSDVWNMKDKLAARINAGKTTSAVNAPMANAYENAAML
ncbi:hypothetical protein Bca101_057976 [Brassica carinata]